MNKKYFSDEERREARKKYNREYNRKYRETHKEYYNEKSRKYYNDNREERLEYNREYRETHKEQKRKYYNDHKEEISEYSRKYREDHKEYCNECSTTWAYNHFNDDGVSYKQFNNQAYQMIKKLKKKCNYTCEICGTSAKEVGTRRIHAHHIVPFKENGKNDPDNILIVCTSCHAIIEGKGWDFIEEYRRELNKL